MCDHHEALQVDDACLLVRAVSSSLPEWQSFSHSWAYLLPQGFKGPTRRCHGVTERNIVQVLLTGLYVSNTHEATGKQVQDVVSHTLAELECH